MDQQSTETKGLLPTGYVISNRYIIKSALGTGGMGSVYLAQDTVLEGTQIAIKVLHSDIAGDQAQSKRFLREVQLMREVNNPYVVRTFDVGLDGDVLYYTMEYVQGTSLTSLMNDQPMDITLLSSIVHKVCLGLQAIHEKEIIHRDLKPANIMVLDDMQIKITDFGVARSKGSNLTQHDEIIGSVSYIAPEVWLGKPLTHSVDLYSLGIILFELLIGKVPFDDGEPATMMWYHVKQPPISPKSLNENIPNWLSQITVKLLAKTPEERPRSAKEVSDVFARNIAAGNAKTENNSSSRINNPTVAAHLQAQRYKARENARKKVFSRRWMVLSTLSVGVLTYYAYVAYSFISSLLLL